MNVMNVERSLIKAPTLLNIRGLSLVRNLMTVRNVEKSLAVAQTSFAMREFILDE
jgi:hypothetical protein